MNETIFIYGFVYGGFIAALVFLLIATFIRKLNWVRRLLLVLTFLALVYQGGCFMVLGGIGTATGGSDIGAHKMMVSVAVAVIIAFVWSYALVVLSILRSKRKEADGSERNKTLPENTSGNK